MKAIVYSKPHCQGCRATKRQLLKLGMDFEIREIENYPEVAAALRETNQLMMPYVQIIDGDTNLDHWNGLKPDKIKQWAGAAQDAA